MAAATAAVVAAAAAVAQRSWKAPFSPRIDDRGSR